MWRNKQSGSVILLDQRRKKNRREQKKKRRFHPVYLVLLLVFLLFALGLFYVTFRLEKVTISGCEYYTEDQIKEKLITGRWKNNTLLFYLSFQKNPKTIPMVQKIDIQIKNKNELEIQIYEKTIIACMSYMSSYLYIDKDGILVETLTKQLENIPVITGVDCKNMTIYEPLQVEDEEIFQKILNLSLLIKKEKMKVDRLSFDYNKKVTLYSGDIKVLLGKRDNYNEQMKKLTELLDKAEKRGLKGTFNLEDYKEGQTDIYFTQDN